MTKKDYQAIAAAIARVRQHEPIPSLDAAGQNLATLDSVQREIANALSADNPRFDRDRFEAACEAD
jgi:hypothetical protein